MRPDSQSDSEKAVPPAVFIAGKEYPDGSPFAQAARGRGRIAALTVSQAEEKEAQPGATFAQPAPLVVEWNKASPVSARAAIIETENRLTKIDEAVLFFDTPMFASRYPTFSAANSSRALDDMIAGYLHITRELLERVPKRGRGSFVFLLKETAADSPSALSQAGILAQTGAAAFRAFSERIAYAYAQENSVRVFLFLAAAQQGDGEIARWLFSYLDESNRDQSSSGTKQKWVKCGTKIPSGFASKTTFFKRQ
jgi:hypothetical protein